MARKHSEGGASRVGKTLVTFAALALGMASAGGAVSAQVEAPQRGEPLEIAWMTVGDRLEIDASSAFVGAVDSYSARSDNESAVYASAAGSIVSLTAVAEGVAFVEVTATNTGGNASQWIAVISSAAATTDGNGKTTDAADDSDPDGDGAPEDHQPPTVDDSQPLGIALASQAFCWGSQIGHMRTLEEYETGRIDRSQVGSFELSYTVVGGRPPYAVTSADAVGTASSPSGVLELACGVPAAGTGTGSEREYQHDKSGPVTITVQVGDAAGAAASTEVVVWVSSGMIEVDDGDGTISVLIRVPELEKPGHTYVLGTPTAWTLVTLAPSLDLRFEGLGEDGAAYFADRDTGWEVRLDWVTGAEVGRTGGVIPETNPLLLGTRPIDDGTSEMMSEG